MDILLGFQNIQANAGFSALYKTDHSSVTQGKKPTQKKAHHTSRKVGPRYQLQMGWK